MFQVVLCCSEWVHLSAQKDSFSPELITDHGGDCESVISKVSRFFLFFFVALLGEATFP